MQRRGRNRHGGASAKTACICGRCRGVFTSQTPSPSSRRAGTTGAVPRCKARDDWLRPATFSPPSGSASGSASGFGVPACGQARTREDGKEGRGQPLGASSDVPWSRPPPSPPTPWRSHTQDTVPRAPKIYRRRSVLCTVASSLVGPLALGLRGPTDPTPNHGVPGGFPAWVASPYAAQPPSPTENNIPGE